MTALEFEDRVINWAKRRNDVEALVLGGSRSSVKNEPIDQWADWDFQIITRRPQLYYGTKWLDEIVPPWSAHAERTPRGVVKVSAIFEGGLEADFVPLAAWQMKLVYFAMKHPEWASRMPRKLYRGIQETRGFVLGSGFRLISDDPRWAKRFEALKISWPEPVMSEVEFSHHVSAFWQKGVWVFKKIARPEPRSALHWLHLLIVGHVYALLAEEARLEGRSPRPEARKAERWLSASRLADTELTTSTHQVVLARALLQQMTLLKDVSEKVAMLRGFAAPDHQHVEAWLRSELNQLIA
jgi:hypothetical protein